MQEIKFKGSYKNYSVIIGNNILNLLQNKNQKYMS